MLRKLTAAVIARPTVVGLCAVATLVIVATLVGDGAAVIDSATLGTENGTLVEPTDGGGWGGPHEVEDGGGS